MRKTRSNRPLALGYGLDEGQILNGIAETRSITPRNSQALRDLVDYVRPNLIVEFGSWEGRSALAFLTQSKISGLTTRIICVDTWLGSAEHWADLLPGTEFSYDNLRVQSGEPQVLNTFKQAIREHGFNKQVEIVRAPTHFAAPFLRRTGVAPELIYIDADHSLPSVLLDLQNADLIAKDATLAGDDWSWQSVRLGVGLFHKRKRIVMSSKDNQQFVLLPPSRKRLKASLLTSGWKIERFIILRELPYLFWSLTVRFLKKKVKRPAASVLDRAYLALGIPGIKARLFK